MAQQKLNVLGVTDDIEAALMLFEPYKDKVVSGIGIHGASGPISAAFWVVAQPTWADLDKTDMEVLQEKGWSEMKYNAFMSWYEGPPRGLRPKKEKFLRDRFESKKNPPKHPT